MRKNCPAIVALTGFIILIIGVACSWYAFPQLIEHLIDEKTALKEGTQAYREWKKQSFPLKFKIHFFNVTNPSDVQNGAKPILKEMGPYIYDEYREKVNIKVDDKADTLNYILRKTYFFNQKESGCRNEDDVVTLINAALMGTVLQVEMMLPTAMSMVTEAIPYLYPDAKDIFIRPKVRDILFDGITIHCEDPEVEFLCGAMKGVLPPTMKQHENGKDFVFSMFGHLNGTDDGPYIMARGIKNKTNRGDILSFKGEKRLTHWNGKYCNQINGSDSTVFTRMIKPQKRLYSFAQDFCRSLYATFIEETVFRDIHVYKYEAKEESMAVSEENNCFCPILTDDDGKQHYDCPKSGLINIMPCVKAPILVSYPHFLLADKSLLDYAIGIKPDPELHSTFAYFEPRTATPISGFKRVQMNIEVKSVNDFPLLENVTNGLFPILWIEEGVDIPDNFLKLLQSSFTKIGVLDITKWILIITGIVVMVSAFILVLQKENLMCFSKVGSMDVSIPKRVHSINISTISDVHFNNSAMYPNLYPQIEQKNVHDNHRRVSNNNQEVWQFKQ